MYKTLHFHLKKKKKKEKICFQVNETLDPMLQHFYGRNLRALRYKLAIVSVMVFMFTRKAGAYLSETAFTAHF